MEILQGHRGVVFVDVRAGRDIVSQHFLVCRAVVGKIVDNVFKLGGVDGLHQFVHGLRLEQGHLHARPPSVGRGADVVDKVYRRGRVSFRQAVGRGDVAARLRRLARRQHCGDECYRYYEMYCALHWSYGCLRNAKLIVFCEKRACRLVL